MEAACGKVDARKVRGSSNRVVFLAVHSALQLKTRRIGGLL